MGFKLSLNLFLVRKYIFSIFFVLLIAMPFEYKGFKIFLLLLLLSFSFLNIGNILNSKINKSLLFVFIIFIVANIFFLLLGIINNNIGVWKTLPVNLIWHILYFIILLDSRFYIEIKEMDFILKTSFLIISLYIILFYLNFLLEIPEFLSLNFVKIAFDPGNPVATANQIDMPAATCLFFLVPFFIARVLVSREKKLADILYLILGLAISLATGRRALLLLIFVSPVVILILALVLPCRKRSVINRVLKRISIIVLMGSIVVFILEKYDFIDVSFLIKKTVTYFIPAESGLEAGAIIRDAQRSALLEKWKDRPIFGHGYGSVAEGYIRNHRIPWAYELSYVSKLMNIGIIGLSIYLFYIGIILLNLASYSKSNYVFYLSSITGFITILIANSTNPYLDSFEYMWMIYFQVLLVLIGPKMMTEN